MARRIEQVEHAIPILERHHGGNDRDAALPLDSHPVGSCPPPLTLGADIAGKLNGAAGPQQTLGQRRFAGIGVGNNGEGSAASDLGGDVCHGATL